MKILITKPKGNDVFETFFTDKAIKEIEKLGEVKYNPHGREYTREELKAELKDIDVVFTGWGATCYDEELLENADKLKVIAHTGGSAAALISDELKKRNIILLSGNRLYAESVAEGALTYILMAQRKMLENISDMETLGWPSEYHFTKGLKKKTVGIVGFGMIAKNLARILSVFDVKIKIYSSYLSKEEAAEYNAEVCTLDEIFETCDIISVHSGLNAKNLHLIDKKLFSKMKDDALIVNTARGAVLNEDDLISELKTGRIRAVLDVYEIEPLPEDSGLRGLPNVILVPHKGGPTTDVREVVTIELCKDIEKYFSGNRELAHEISFEYASRMTNESKFMKKQ